MCSLHLSTALICLFLKAVGKGVTPGEMWLVAARQDGYEVLDWSPRYALCGGQHRVGVRSIAILEYGTLLGISV